MAESIQFMLKFLYNNRIGKFIRPLFAARWFSCFCGFFADLKISRFFIKSFIRRYKIDMSEYEVPAQGYKTFNEFFYRGLKPGARLIDPNPDVAVSPADCKLLVIERLTPDSSFFVKNCKFSLESFLQRNELQRNELQRNRLQRGELAAEFSDGEVFLFRLAPHNYHRFHFPFDCFASKPTVINGKFESVDPVVYKSGVQPLTENERHLIILNSEKFGKVLFVPVGATVVGKIKYSFTPDKFYKKGEEFGCFALGGSSIVMIFSKGVITPDQAFIQNSLQNLETEIKMGQRVARA